MPATRSVPRHGSRQPVPYVQDNAGPSQPHPIIVHVGNDNQRRKGAADRKASGQRSKQKARAYLPPDAEVIEISSDDEAPPVKKVVSPMSLLEKRIKELEEENNKLVAAVVAAKTAPPPPPPQPKVQAPVADLKFLSAIEDHVTCEVCTLKMWHPYSLACGHTFCKDCLLDWFNTAFAQHLTNHPHYDPHKLIPAQWKVTLARPDIPQEVRTKLEREVAAILSKTPHPQYSCPTCRVLVKNVPAENFVVKHIVRTVAAAQGELSPKEGPLQRDGPFDGFFPYPR